MFELTVDSSSTTTVAESPLDPTTRYNQRINILYQPTFEMPGWQGHLFAFRNDGTFQARPPDVNPSGIWEAGETLVRPRQPLHAEQQPRGPRRTTSSPSPSSTPART